MLKPEFSTDGLIAYKDGDKLSLAELAKYAKSSGALKPDGMIKISVGFDLLQEKKQLNAVAQAAKESKTKIVVGAYNKNQSGEFTFLPNGGGSFKPEPPYKAPSTSSPPRKSNGACP